MVGMRIAHTVLVLDDLLSWGDRLLAETCLIAPRAVEMTEPYVSSADRQTDRGKLSQRNGLGLTVLDFRPSLNHIYFWTSHITEIYRNWIDGVFHADTRDGPLLFNIACSNKCCREVAVGMSHGKGSFCRTVHAVGGIGVHASAVGALHVLQVAIAELSTEIYILGLFPLVHIQNHRGVLSLDNNLFCRCSLNTGHE